MSNVLLVRPAPVRGESRGSLLLRTAGANFRFGIRGLASDLGKDPMELLTMPSSNLAELLWPDSSLQLSRAKLLSAMLPPVYVNGLACRRVCPLCLDTDGESVEFGRCQWDGHFNLFCSKHSALLRDDCRICEQALDYLTQPEVGLCRCGARLREQSAEAIPTWMSIVPWIFKATDKGSACEDKLQKQAAEVIHKLALAAPHEWSLEKPTTSTSPAFVTARMLKTVAPCFIDWPNGLNRKLASLGWRHDEEGTRRVGEWLNVDDFPAIGTALEDIARQPDRRPTAVAVSVARAKINVAALAWYPRLMTRISLPRRRSRDASSWEGCALGLRTVLTNREHKEANERFPESHDLPSNTASRLLICWLTSECIRRSSSLIDSTNSLKPFLKRVGIETHSGGINAPRTRIRVEFVNLLRCQMSVYSALDARVPVQGLENVTFGDFHGEPGSFPWAHGTILISNWFYAECVRDSFKVNLESLKALRGSVWSIDVYLFLLSLANEGQREFTSSWKDLRSSFSTEVLSLNKFRETIRRAFARVATVCPEMNARFEPQGLYIQFGRRLTSNGC